MGFDFRGMNGAVNAGTSPGAHIAAEDYYKVKRWIPDAGGLQLLR